MTVYILHFDRPYIGTCRAEGNKQQSVKHYIGYTENIETRMEAHRKGNGARVVQVLSCAGIGFSVGLSIDGDRKLEKKLKREGHPERHCSICKGAAMTGISADHGTRAEIHPDDCRCLACVDVEIVKEDSESITGTTYHGIPLRNEREMQKAATLADQVIIDMTKWHDQIDDVLDWKWMRGDLAL